MTNDTSDDGADVSLDSGIEYEIDEDERPSEAVVRAVASFTNTAVLDLPPLYEVVDPEHLDEVPDRPDDAALRAFSFTFRFAGCEVTVTRDAVSVRDDDT